MTDALNATDPGKNISVLASAGTGKTWQLVARITRLLLSGAPIDRILAITFTRKAAGEMQQRMTERLHDLLLADQSQLGKLLEEIGESSNPATQTRARQLLEQWLRSERPLRTTTFHSFCQELLQRFPLEAGIPPGFELIEQTGLLVEESWDALFAEVTRKPEQVLAEALEYLSENLNGISNTRSVLETFVHHRSDWWAYTEGMVQPVDKAIEQLQNKLGVDLQQQPLLALWNGTLRQQLKEFAVLLERHATKTNANYATLLFTTLEEKPLAEVAISTIKTVFITTTGGRRARKSMATQQKKMGAEGEQQFLDLHDQLCGQLEDAFEQLARQNTLYLNQAWYRAGQCILDHYQRLKRERRLLDFADLEWNACRLLNDPEHAHWIQYKLDQGIDHLLIDEFQDTNPTQWRLILPLLEEIAAGSERPRSLFIVGDSKQSIYRFRRGNPRLLTNAAQWMNEQLAAQSIHLDKSWRSSAVIMDFVNRVFENSPLGDVLCNFREHQTHRSRLWGKVEIWPLVETKLGNTEAESTNNGLRNPLKAPRPETRNDRHYQEGAGIARRILQLIDQGIQVGEGQDAHRLGYRDILILMRSRTHLSDYEAALRDHGIPYLSLDRGTLLQSLEIRDLESLLVVLMTPQANLALAQVLRSPIFSLTNEDLMELAKNNCGSWYERLEQIATRLPDEHRIVRAQRLLTGWLERAGRIPIHDLLERIFHESNLLARYQAAVADTQVARVTANLKRFIELALEVDSGRYPSLPRFLERLSQMRNLKKEGPSQALPESDGGERVHLLTIHGSKGLEAPVVFLADTNSASSNPSGYKTLIRWPAESDRPVDFQLLSAAKKRDDISQAGYETEQQEEQRESANLLYVAITRTQHMLCISGIAREQGSLGWYKKLVEAVGEESTMSKPWMLGDDQPLLSRSKPKPFDHKTIAIDHRLRKRITAPKTTYEIAPSQSVEDNESAPGDALGLQRGRVIHRMLELLNTEGISHDKIINRLTSELQMHHDHPNLLAWWQEAMQTFNHENTAWVFNTTAATRAWNEVPLHYLHNEHTVHGIIDRLLRIDNTLHIIDYKTHRIDEADEMEQLREHYRPQINLYCQGIQRLWPDCTVRSYLLFTCNAELVTLS